MPQLPLRSVRLRRRTVYVVMAALAVLATCGLLLALLLRSDDGAATAPTPGSFEPVHARLDVLPVRPDVRDALERLRGCLEDVYRNNLQRSDDYDHGAAAAEYVGNWTPLLYAHGEQSQLDIINGELIAYDCAPLEFTGER